MPNIASVLKEEITRLARKEIRTQLSELRKESKDQRKEITALKKQIASLEKAAVKVKRAGPVPKKTTAEKPDETKVGLTAKGLKSHRKRMGISAGDYAKLAGVSAATVYNFESGKSNPRQSVLQKLDAARSFGKREIKAHFEALNPKKEEPAKAKAPRAKRKSTGKASAKSTTAKKGGRRKKAAAPAAEKPAEEAK